MARKMMKRLSLSRIEPVAVGERTENCDQLAQSITQNGLLQPIIVTARGGKYRVVAGKRRLCAATQAGLQKIPVVVVNADEKESLVLSLVENLHRENPDVFMQGEAMNELSELGMTREEIARRLALSRSAVSNKIRLLQFEETQRRFAVEKGLTERHLRALLRLPQDLRDTALFDVAAKSLNVAATELYVSRLLESDILSERKHPVIRDVRIFFNTITRAVEVMNRSGIGAVAIRRDTEQYIEYIIKIPAPEREKAQ